MAEAGPRPNVHTKYTMPGAPWYNVDMYLRWEHAARRKEAHEVSDSNVFMALHFGLECGTGGYIGLQQFGNPSRDNLAIFSIWNHADAPAHGWQGSGDTVEDGGFALRQKILYPWKEGREYRLRVWQVHPQGKVGYVGSVFDVASQDLAIIGTTITPDVAGYAGYGRISRFTNVFTEYFTSFAGCSKPYNRAVWRGPYANGGTIRPIQATAGYPPEGEMCMNTCARGAGYPIVVHESGGDVAHVVPNGSPLW